MSFIISAAFFSITFHVLGQIQQVAIQYWVIAQTLVIFQTNLKGTAQLQLLQLLWALGDVIFYAEWKILSISNIFLKKVKMKMKDTTHISDNMAWEEEKRSCQYSCPLKRFFINLEKNCADNNWSSMNNLSFLKWSQFSHVLDLHWFWAIFLDCFRQASEESTFKFTSCESIKNVINPLYILHGTVLPHCFHSIFNNLVGNCHHVLLDIEWWWIHKNKYN